MNDFYVHPVCAVQVDANGAVYVLVPEKDKVFIKKAAPTQAMATLNTSSRPTNILAHALSAISNTGDLLKLNFTKVAQFVENNAKLQDAMALPFWTKDDANAMAWEFIQNSWYCTYADYTRDCGDLKPHYITTYNVQSYSVPYCWGGWDLKADFNYYMQNDYKDAGDINCTGYSQRSCTAGTDCSGYVSRMWGLSTKHSTTMLDDNPPSVAGNKNNMAEADIYDWPGHHVVLFRYYSATGYSAIFEATTTDNVDRCINTIRANSYFSSYGAYKRAEWGV